MHDDESEPLEVHSCDHQSSVNLERINKLRNFSAKRLCKIFKITRVARSQISKTRSLEDESQLLARANEQTN